MLLHLLQLLLSLFVFKDGAKLRKVESKTKETRFFFLPRRSNFAILMAKLRKKSVTKHGFWRINAEWP